MALFYPTSHGTCLILAYRWDLKLRLETMNTLRNFVGSVSVGDTPKEQYVQGEHGSHIIICGNWGVPISGLIQMGKSWKPVLTQNM